MGWREDLGEWGRRHGHKDLRGHVGGSGVALSAALEEGDGFLLLGSWDSRGSWGVRGVVTELSVAAAKEVKAGVARSERLDASEAAADEDAEEREWCFRYMVDMR